MRKLTENKLSQLLRNTVVKDEAGKPLLVFRGQHGVVDHSNPSMQTSLGSLSFGDAQTASHYATSPNDRRMVAENPVVYPAYLVINNPFVADASDPFIDYSVIAHKVGKEVADRFFLKYADHVENTDNWLSEVNGKDEFTCIDDFYQRCPERMSELYVQLYPLLDDPEFIQELKAKGYDGALHCGSGENAREPEYRVFDESSVIFALSKEYTPRKSREATPDAPEMAA